MMPEQFQKLLEKYSRGNCTPEEEQFISEWYENIPSKNDPVLDQEEKLQVQHKIWSAIKPQEVAQRRWAPILMRAAVVTIPLLAFAIIYFSRQPIKSLVKPLQGLTSVFDASEKLHEKNTGDKPMKVALADGSTVVLQPASEILVSEEFGISSREVYLKGEGFFQVTPDAGKPFLVYANEVVTRVLGTSFNVRAYEDDKEVTVAVKTGKVSVYANKDKTSRQVMQSPEVILTPNQQMVYHRLREVISKSLVEEPEIIVPNSQLFMMQFENAEVSEIFDLLSENYGVEIRYDSERLSNCRLTTSMSDEGLYERIEVICKAIGASFSIDDDAAITIKSNGC